ncbi:hypothetical protein P152DRAFT_254509 [Eremomyces bilateralis CBS 781.70]|uniref:Secreted protein n=1 Tax=Eremomyces bilateralis CBS 781.70 TaxID=1392243 RepID=A0A6G1FQU5_9PEZI|nr:uncharacterized protein P152DRAFT_254509 [Eremomyces bilateralis CBS 781.70]KAF1808164.1 hypothetical protein P152DRAFT_254509 [Eremomyces bilateralis CBS 781.70]
MLSHFIRILFHAFVRVLWSCIEIRFQIRTYLLLFSRSCLVRLRSGHSFPVVLVEVLFGETALRIADLDHPSAWSNRRGAIRIRHVRKHVLGFLKSAFGGVDIDRGMKLRMMIWPHRSDNYLTFPVGWNWSGICLENPGHNNSYAMDCAF